MSRLRNLVILLTTSGFLSLATASTFHLVIPLKRPALEQAPALGPISVALTPFELPAGVVGLPYARVDLNPLLRVTGDPGFNSTGVSWSIGSGSLPAGLVLNADGTISGTPTAAGVTAFTASATYKTETGSQVYDIVVHLPVSLELQTTAGVKVTTVNFGSIPVGMYSSQNFNLVNRGSSAVTLASPVFQTEAPFGIEQHACGATLAAGAKCNVSLQFTPKTQASFSKGLSATHHAGTTNLGDIEGAGGPLDVVVTAVSTPGTFAADTYQNISVTFKNNTAATVKIIDFYTDYTGAFQYEPNPGVIYVPANGTATLAGKIIVGAGVHDVPLHFATRISSSKVPVTYGTVKVTATKSHTYTASESFSKSQVLPPQIERVNHSGLDFNQGAALSNASGTASAAERAVKITVPANAVSPNLIMYGVGRDGSTISVHEGSNTGTLAFRKTFGTWTGAIETFSTNLVPGRTYYIVPRNNGSFVGNLHYAALRWN